MAFMAIITVFIIIIGLGALYPLHRDVCFLFTLFYITFLKLKASGKPGFPVIGWLFDQVESIMHSGGSKKHKSKDGSRKSSSRSKDVSKKSKKKKFVKSKKSNKHH